MKVKTLFTAIVLLAISISASYAQFSSEAEMKIYNQALAAVLKKEYIEETATGYGRTKGAARIAARTLAQRQLVNFINRTRIDSETLVADAELVRDEVRRQVSGMIQFAEEVDATYQRTEDGKWEATVKMRIPLKLSLAKPVRQFMEEKIRQNPPQLFNMSRDELEAQKAQEEVKLLKRRNLELESEIEKLRKIIEQGLATPGDKEKLRKLETEREKLVQLLAEKDERIKELQGKLEELRRKAQEAASKPDIGAIVNKGPYTGLIVDARGLGVQMAMAPKILTQAGFEIYGFVNVLYHDEMNHGMVLYEKDVEKAKRDLAGIIGENPLIVKAIGVRGRNKTDVVVDDTTAVAIFASDVRDHFLELGKVVFVID
jgi:hypothetical protein